MLFWVLTLTVFANLYGGVESRPPPVVVAGYTYAPRIGYHKIHSHAATRATARAICKEEGGDLAIINSKQELDVIQQLLTLSLPHIGTNNSNYVIIGLNNRTIEDQNGTVEAVTLAWAAFNERLPNEPNNERVPEDYGIVYENGHLHYINFNDTFAIVCERPEKFGAPNLSVTPDCPCTKDLATTLRPRRGSRSPSGCSSCYCYCGRSSSRSRSCGGSSSCSCRCRSGSSPIGGSNSNYYFLSLCVLTLVLNKLHAT